MSSEPKLRSRSQRRNVNAKLKKMSWKPVHLDENLMRNSTESGLLAFEEIDAEEFFKHTKKPKLSAAADDGLTMVDVTAAALADDDGEATTADSATPSGKPKKNKQKSKKQKAKQAQQQQQTAQDAATEHDEDLPVPSAADTAVTRAAAEEAGAAKEPPKKRRKATNKKPPSAAAVTVAVGDTVERVAPDEPAPEAAADGEDEQQQGKLLEAEQEQEDDDVDMSAWAEFQLHPLLLASLRKLRFAEPTPIQRRALLAAVRDGKDVIGAAETGSGKTLAFGLPILHRLLSARDRRQQQATAAAADGEVGEKKRLKALILTPTRELALQVCAHLKAAAAGTDIKVVAIVGGISAIKQRRLLSLEPEVVVATPGRFWELVSQSSSEAFESDLGGVEFLVLDEADRMVERGHFQELHHILRLLPKRSKAAKKSQQQQQRQQPGRQRRQGQSNAASNDDDETEEQAEAEEAEDGPEEEHGTDDGDDEETMMPAETRLPTQQPRPTQKPRHTYVFSATLTLEAPRGKKAAARPQAAQQQQQQPIDALMETIDFQRKVANIDLTHAKQGLVETLHEAKIDCLDDDKDFYLYYFLTTYPGRTLVFVNSISCIRRLLPLLQALKLPAYGLHASMQQKQRLKNLDRFTSNETCVLVCTDVAARGLDIPAVNHVVHYQTPASAELYVHRAGRTARAKQQGLSVLLVGAKDRASYKAICFQLGKDDKLPSFPVDRMVFEALQQRVLLARKLDEQVHAVQKVDANDSWLAKTAREADLDIDDDVSDDDGEAGMRRKQQAARIGQLRGELAQSLSRPIEVAKYGEDTSAKHKLVAAALHKPSPRISASKGGAPAVAAKQPPPTALAVDTRLVPFSLPLSSLVIRERVRGGNGGRHPAGNSKGQKRGRPQQSGASAGKGNKFAKKQRRQRR